MTRRLGHRLDGHRQVCAGVVIEHRQPADAGHMGTRAPSSRSAARGPAAPCGSLGLARPLVQAEPGHSPIRGYRMLSRLRRPVLLATIDRCTASSLPPTTAGISSCRARPEITEVNFWRPGGDPFRALAPGEPFFFKLKRRTTRSVGSVCSRGPTRLPVWRAWDVFG